MPLASSWKFYLLHEEVVAHSSAKLELTASLLAAAAPDGWQLIRSCVFFVGRGPCAVQAATGDRCVFIRCEQIHRNTSRVDDFDDAIKGSRKAPGNQSFAIRKDKKPVWYDSPREKACMQFSLLFEGGRLPRLNSRKQRFRLFPPVSASASLPPERRFPALPARITHRLTLDLFFRAAVHVPLHALLFCLPRLFLFELGS